MKTTLKILQGDCRELIKSIPEASVQCVVTSPPYWGLRSYLPKDHPNKHLEIGQEKTPEDYVNTMVQLFREVRRILKNDGTVWLNIGDSYSGIGKGGNPTAGKQATNKGSQSVGVLYGTGQTAREAALTNVSRRWTTDMGMAPKNLIGIPWRVAFALQGDGWYLRSDIIWHKPNPMPESVKDRPTRSHEYIFLLTKSPRYFYDAEAIKEQPSPELVKQIEEGYKGHALKDYLNASVQDASKTKSRIIQGYRNRIDKQRGHGRRHNGFNDKWDALTPKEQALCGRNKRDVWTVAPANYPESHFATFPPKLIEPCILAGSRVGDTVLDPFGGSGVTGKVALEWNRNAILFDLNEEYISMMRKRTKVQPYFSWIR